LIREGRDFATFGQLTKETDMLNKSIAIAGNEQAQQMIQGGASVPGVTLPAASTYKPDSSRQDQGRSLLAPSFVAAAYAGTSTAVALDAHEQARRLLVAQ